MTQKPRVLVVEDSRALASFVQGALELDGYAVTIAHDGEEGLALAKRHLPDLVLSDLMMPRKDGAELLADLRRDPQLKHVPVILLTASDDRTLRERLLQSGAQDYVIKPCSTAELRARVANWLQQKKARDTLKRALAVHSDDLLAMSEALAVAREQAEQASRAKTAFLASISHDLLTPLATIRMQLDALAGPDANVDEAALDRMRRSTTRLVELVESVVSFVQVESGRLKLEPERIDAVDLAERVVQALKPRADRKRIQLSVDSVAPGTWMQSDRRLLELSLRQLIVNAIKFTAQGSVHVSVAHAPPHVAISVRDTGPGIEEQDRTSIFEPFARGEDAAHKHDEGLGLGLALVRQVARALGADLGVETEPGAGSTFTLLVPVTRPTLS